MVCKYIFDVFDGQHRLASLAKAENLASLMYLYLYLYDQYLRSNTGWHPRSAQAGNLASSNLMEFSPLVTVISRLGTLVHCCRVELSSALHLICTMFVI